MADAMEAAEQLNPLRESMAGSSVATAGPHARLGSHRARLGMRAVMEERYRRIPYWRPEPGGSDRAEWLSGLTGLDSLPLAFPPGGGLA